MADPIQWLTTAPNPRSPATGYDAGQRGWVRHAVRARDEQKFTEIRNEKAACGLRPAHGWDLDLFIERKCKRCIKAIGKKVCTYCHGYGCAACDNGEARHE